MTTFDRNAVLNTIAYSILKLNKEANLFDINEKHFEILDNILIEAQNKINIKSLYSREDALEILNTIHRILIDKGFRYKKNCGLLQYLEEGFLNCQDYCGIYHTIGEFLNLPLFVVRIPYHTFIRWRYDNRNKFLNWETTNGMEKTDEDYITSHGVDQNSIRMGVYLKDMNKYEILSGYFNTRGSNWSQKDDTKKLSDYEESIRRSSLYPFPYSKRAFIYTIKNRYNEALEDCNRAITYNPRYIGCICRKSGIYEKIGNKEESLKNYSIATKMQPIFTDEYRDRAEAWLAHDEFDNAIMDISVAIEKEPEDADTYTIRAKIYEKMNEMKKAADDYLKAAILDYKNFSNKYNLEQLLEKIEDKNFSLKAYSSLIELAPSDRILYYQRGKTYEKIGAFDDALNDFLKIIEIEPNRALGYACRGDVYFKLKNYNRALEEYNKAVEFDIMDMYFEERGKIHERLSNYHDAIKDYCTALEEDDFDSFISDNLERMFSRIKDIDLRLELIDEVIKLIPKEPYPYIKRGKFWEEKGDLIKAENVFQFGINLINETIRDKPKDTLLINKRAEMWEYLGDWEKALVDRNKRLECERPNSFYYSDRARLYIKNGNFDSAMKDCDKAVHISIDAKFDNPHLRYRDRGQLFEICNDYTNALKDYFFEEAYTPINEFKNYPFSIVDKFNRIVSTNVDLNYLNSQLNTLIKLNPTKLTLLKFRGDIYQKMGLSNNANADYINFINQMNNQINEEPYDPQLKRIRGRYNYLIGEYYKAREDYNSAIDHRPDEFLLERWEINLALKDFKNALTDLDKHLTSSIYLDERVVIYKIIVTLIQKNDIETAISEYHSIIEAFPLDNHLIKILENILKYNICTDHVIRFYTQIIEKNPLNVTALINRTYFHLSKKDNQSALNDSMQALQLNDQDGKIYEAIGDVHFSLGEYNKSLKNYDISIYKENKNTYYKRGDLLKAMGEKDKARIDYEKSVEYYISEENLEKLFMVRCKSKEL